MTEKTKIRVAIIGGGIKGCSLAALLTRDDRFNVKLFEARDKLAGGITSANHGRLHSGSSLWKDYRYWGEMSRRTSGAEALRKLGFGTTLPPSVHFVSPRLADEFERACRAQGVVLSKLDAIPPDVHTWVRGGYREWPSYLVEEYAFNPAQVTRWLANRCLRIKMETPVKRVDRNTNGHLALGCTDGDFHHVVNALGGWLSSVSLNGRVPTFNVEYPSSTLLCIPNKPVGASLHRVITIVDGQNDLASAIPQAESVVIACDIEGKQNKTLHDNADLDQKQGANVLKKKAASKQWKRLTAIFNICLLYTSPSPRD